MKDNMVVHITFLASEVMNLQKMNALLTERITKLEEEKKGYFDDGLFFPPMDNIVPPLFTNPPFSPPPMEMSLPLEPPMEMSPPLAPPLLSPQRHDSKRSSRDFTPPPFVTPPPAPSLLPVEAKRQQHDSKRARLFGWVSRHRSNVVTCARYCSRHVKAITLIPGLEDEVCIYHYKPFVSGRWTCCSNWGEYALGCKRHKNISGLIISLIFLAFLL